VPEELRLARFFFEFRNQALELGGEAPRLESCERVGQGAVVPQGRLVRDVKPLPYSLTDGVVVRQERSAAASWMPSLSLAALRGRAQEGQP
jgi:hypothetical protein